MRIKLGVIFLVSVIALAGVSGSYAFSSSAFDMGEKLGIIDMGKFDYLDLDLIDFPEISSSCGKVGVKIVENDDPGPNYLHIDGNLFPINSPNDGTSDPQYSPGSNNEGKNVASTISYNGECSCSMLVDDECVTFYKDGTVCISNAYPWYSSGLTLWYGNCGSIPITVSEAKFEVTSGSTELMKFLKVHNWEISIDGSFFASGSSFKDLKDTLKTVMLCPKSVMSLDLDFHFEEEYEDCNSIIHIMPQTTTMQFQFITAWKQACC